MSESAQVWLLCFLPQGIGPALLHGTGSTGGCSQALTCARGADLLLGCVWQWPKTGCGLKPNNSWSVHYRRTWSYSSVVVSSTSRSDILTHNSYLSFLLCLSRVFQRWPNRVLDLDVLHIFHGEVGAPAGWHALLRPPETLLRQRGEHRGQKGELWWVLHWGSFKVTWDLVLWSTWHVWRIANQE